MIANFQRISKLFFFALSYVTDIIHYFFSGTQSLDCSKKFSIHPHNFEFAYRKIISKHFSHLLSAFMPFPFKTFTLHQLLGFKRFSTQKLFARKTYFRSLNQKKITAKAFRSETFFFLLFLLCLFQRHL